MGKSEIGIAGVAHTGPQSAREGLDLLEQLYRDEHRRIVAICFGVLRDRHEAEDATQETFLRAVKHLSRLSGDPVAYLTMVARSVCVDIFRVRASRERSMARFLNANEAEDPDRVLMDRLVIARVWAHLSAHDRELVAHHFAGFSYHEIARRTGVSEKAVSVGLTRARQRARKYRGAAVPAILPPISPLGRVLAWLRSAWRRLTLPRTQVNGIDAGVSAAALLFSALSALALAVMVGGGEPYPATALGIRSTGSAPVSVPALGMSREEVVRQGQASAGTEGRGHYDAAPPAGRPSGIGAVVGGLINPGQKARSDQTVVTSLTPSPGYGADGTVFAPGALITGCARPVGCPVLFQTRDRGATWNHLVGSGFAGGSILLPPTYPTDPTIFASGPTGVQRSADGGAAFTLALPIVGPAAIDPASAAGDAQILIGSVPMVLFAAGSRAVAPGPTLPVDVTQVDDVAFGSVPGTVLVAGERLGAVLPSMPTGVLMQCRLGGSCAVVATIPGATPLRFASGHAASGAVIAYSPRELWASSDGGGSYHRLPLPAGTNLSSVAIAARANEALSIVVGEWPGAGASAAVLVSRDAGATFAAAPGGGMPRGHTLAAVQILSDGRMLAALGEADVDGLFGVRCSRDWGAAWRLSC